MSTHASANKQWTESELAGLTVERQFRLRGLEVTRMDTFIDAAFAFVLTLLVISFDEIPSNYAEMTAAMKRIPGFAGSFAIIMMFWLEHRSWSRRYGLENLRTIALSLTLIFVLLVYVYPLRMMFEGMFASFSGGFLTSSFQIATLEELRGMLAFYSSGFFAMSLLVSLLHGAGLRNASSLALNPIEREITRLRMQGWAIAAAFGLLSVVLALVLPNAWISVAGYIYFALVPATQLPRLWNKRGRGTE